MGDCFFSNDFMMWFTIAGGLGVLFGYVIGRTTT